MRRNSAGDVPDVLFIDRVLLTGLVSAVVVGLPAVWLESLWGPLVYLFWPAWIVAFVVVWRSIELGISRCPDCFARSWVGAVRCRRCGHSFGE